MIRWEQQGDASWQGSSGELVVATVRRDDDDKEQWLWTTARTDASASRRLARRPGTRRYETRSAMVANRTFTRQRSPCG